MLPIPMHPLLLPELMTGFDRCLQHYILRAKSGCGIIPYPENDGCVDF